MLTADERERFERDGYFVRRGVLDHELVRALITRLSELITRCAAEHLAGTRKSLDFWDILRGSQHDASVCWDPSGGALPDRAEDWEPRAMRVGHGLHLVDDVFERVTMSAEVGGTLAELIGPEPVVAQSAVVYKQPESDVVQFGAHQDAAYITTEPESLVLAFVALDDMDADNGALAVAPGTHREPLHVALAMTDRGFVPVSGSAPAERDYETQLLPMERGTVAFVHGRTIHASAPNRATRPRRSLIIHAFSQRSSLAESCWLEPPADGFPSLLRSSST